MGHQSHLGMALEVRQDPSRFTHGHIQTRPEGNRKLSKRPSKTRLLTLGPGNFMCVHACGCVYTDRLYIYIHAVVGGERSSWSTSLLNVLENICTSG